MIRIFQEVVARDLICLGCQIVSFTLKDVTDDVGYLESLGRTEIARAASNAAIGVAEENREISITTAGCEKEAQLVKYKSRSAIEQLIRNVNLKKADFHQEIQRASATKDLAEEFAKTRLSRDMMRAEKLVEVVTKQKEVEIEEKEIERSSKALICEVNLPTEAEAYKIRWVVGIICLISNHAIF